MGLCSSTPGPAERELDEPSFLMGGNKRALLKVLIIGDSGVGKTSLLSQYCHNTFDTRYKSTIGADFSTKQIVLDNHVVTLQIWDTAGQERFQSLGVAFYRGSDACLLVFSVFDRKSFEHLQKWKNDFLIQAAPEMPDSFPFLVVGNKIDLLEGDGDTPGLKREVSSKEAEQWCQENGNMPYVEASAKVGINLDQIFDTVAERCLMREQTAKRAGYLS